MSGASGLPELLYLSHTSPDIKILCCLYQHLENAAFLRQQLLAGNVDFEYAFIDASMLVSRDHALAAAFRAINDWSGGGLKSRNVHSEIVFALSPNNNIGEAFRRFGVSDTTKDLLVMKVLTAESVAADVVLEHLDQHIKGQLVSFTDDSMQSMHDLDRLRRVYKLTVPGKSPAGSKIVNGNRASESSLSTKDLEVSILGAMALRGAT